MFICSSKKAKTTIASGIRPGSWSAKTPALQLQGTKESVNDRDDNFALGGLQDADVEDEPPTPGTNLDRNNNVSNKFLMQKAALLTYRYSTSQRLIVKLR